MNTFFKYLLTMIGLILFTNSICAQQISQFSQYLNNHYLINPAATNISNSLKLDLSVRKQESKRMNDMNSFYISAYGAIKNTSIKQKTSNGFRLTKYASLSTAEVYNLKPIPVIGVIISKDNFGLVERNTVHASVGMHLPLNARYTLSTAATLGHVLLDVDNHYFVSEDNDLPFNQFIHGFNRESFLDLGLVVWLYSDRLQVGYAIERMFSGNSLNGGNDETFKIRNKHFITVGYKLTLNSEWELIGSTLHKVSSFEKNLIDYSLRVIYKNRIWTALSLRHQQILVFNLGLNLSNSISFNYSYDHGSKNQGIESLPANEVALNFFITKSR